MLTTILMRLRLKGAKNAPYELSIYPRNLLRILYRYNLFLVSFVN